MQLTRFIVVSIALGFLALGPVESASAAQVPIERVSQKQFGAEWPLKNRAGYLSCSNVGLAPGPYEQAVYSIRGDNRGRTYAVNDAAHSTGQPRITRLVKRDATGAK